MSVFFTTLVFLGLTTVIAVSPNGLGMTPQMGWNNWNSAGCEGLSEDLITDTAKKMVDCGYAKSCNIIQPILQNDMIVPSLYLEDQASYDQLPSLLISL